MTVEMILFSGGLGGLFLAMFFYLIFGQITVRKLRNDPKTKSELGMEFMSGLDILNVAGALAMPRWLNRKLRKTPLAFLYANADIIDESTGIFDRILASILYGLFVLSTSTLICLMILNSFGVFD